MKSLLSLIFILSSFCSFNQGETELDTIDTQETYIEEEIVSAKELDKLPEFPEGKEALSRFIIENLVYPQTAIDAYLQGKVYVEFIVTKDGDITSAKVINGIREDLDKAALEVILKMPRWIPAEKNGIKVSTKLGLPIHFVLH